MSSSPPLYPLATSPPHHFPSPLNPLPPPHVSSPFPPLLIPSPSLMFPPLSLPSSSTPPPSCFLPCLTLPVPHLSSYCYPPIYLAPLPCYRVVNADLLLSLGFLIQVWQLMIIIIALFVFRPANDKV